ncbi:short-chain dehydrogenase [Thioclava sediminum]|uniref:Short-chain dehydrogenase n=1 Tax=Thioclava sediminum TaxID=1915319 RepID=A0ABX3N196_9RHOB|nr:MULTISPECIES: SDR family NAD(P)-dependent oxidoreductase [Thioclava]MPQ92650.1 SDR family NAD(P)-dependent oxidoreductase [Thioclava sp. JE_KL1]OOY06732.1 short-chain dehydrogenase [Thioclava sp. F28-4]OOY10749.1 short-chain dehydrogenase [Thioclava sp. F36-7]OOY21851.1 short-chain dehydrogenase [Thioclava sp. DLFJ5-1]OOY25717.1 short-chain dehydrogenase [Thioclava sediminum]
MHPALAKGNVAVVTGGASGIGLAAARHLAGLGMRVCIADLPGAALEAAYDALIAAGAAAADVMTQATDVSDRAQLTALADEVWAHFGPVNLLMNNAGMQPGSSIFDAEGNWDRILDVNMGGIIRGSQIFAPRMIASGAPGLIVNTGSKQGITTPPGDPAYNVSKAGVKAFTEALQHELRNREDCKVEARLFIPGFVYTPLTAGGRTEKPADAWTPEQVVEFLFDSIERGDFYILCPDNDVDRATDVKRILWAAGDITENRPPLSRWHPDYGDAFKAWLKK